MNPTYNFCAGPAMIDPEILATVREDLTDWRGLGRSILEVSHRTSDFKDLYDQTIAQLHTLLNLGDDYTILLLQGGASGQFAMLPYNFLRESSAADYLVRGYWGEKAAQQAARIGRVRVLQEAKGWSPMATYAHVTTNETISGTRLGEDFEQPAVPLCADMSSDILSAPRDYRRYKFFYAGAQKNLGCAGLVIVAAEKEFLSHARRNLPATFCYLEHTRAEGLYHTPNTFAIDVLYHVTKKMLQQGLPAIYAANAAKANKLYAELDRSSFYRALAPVAERSLMNVTFRLPHESLESEFLAQAAERGLVALKGHRALGGVRASIYNAFPEKGVDCLIDFMQYFERTHG